MEVKCYNENQDIWLTFHKIKFLKINLESGARKVAFQNICKIFYKVLDLKVVKVNCTITFYI